ncbi:MAG: GPR endopeptidase [Ruminococcaceae bacterium]|nr:GPR endopeptidase [Oscillospiraceae bacterium]
MEEFARSDLATECGGDREGDGIRVRKSECGGCRLLHVQVRSEAAAARIGKPQGSYVTLECGEIRMLSDSEFDRVRCALSVEIREMAERMCGKRIGGQFSVLVCGLGNGDITADAIGPETVRRLAVTRHLRRMDHALFSTVGLCEISALTPGVLGQTGLETVELVKGAVKAAAPDLVIAVDALAARSVERLSTTVQLSDTGIHPGSGIGNRRKALNAETVGVPVMALGVPTVVDSSTLVFDALHRAGYEPQDFSAELRKTLEEGRSFFVSPKEIDLLVSSVAVLLSGALEKAFAVREGEFS